MNQWTEKVILFVQDLDRRVFLRYVGIMVLSLVAISGFLLYRTQSSINSLTKQLKKVSGLRRRAKEILEKNNAVEAQHKEVDEILSENPNFKIRRYFIDLLESRGLTPGTIVSSEVTNPIDNSYEDITATAKLTDINTKQLTELLQEIELNDRVHVKKLEIVQKRPQSIDVSLTIATLLKKVAS